MMYELRILNGLHRGATLPLDDTPLLIGASDMADVVLVDPGIEERHATLTRTESGWLLTAESGQLSDVDSGQVQRAIDLGVGGCACIGHVWIGIEAEGAPWARAPAASEAAALEVATGDPLPTAEKFPEAENLVPATSEAVASDGAQGRRGGIKGMLYTSVAVITVIGAAAAYAINAKPPASAIPRKTDVAVMLGKTSTGAARNPVAEDPSAIAADLAKTMSQAELQQALRRRLQKADLLSRFDLVLNDQSWELRANLDDDETARFERVLMGFIKEYKIGFPVNAKVVGAENMLPFKIRQVISGNNASVVTQDGERLYIGDQVRGIRLVSVQDTHLVFAGKRKIEVNW
ncbi:type III secretion protein D [Collimonas sp. PA-H2]|uniref:FHA domain-containing protein n=1 Tax=Collimonas sp. PA-H2 TaxID=1881062 RepID=UPI000BF88C4A|nr:FHA domain-containing protein [Collimonas sp. PA-H2]PFH10313.1 type III secretion protein D [Collimonas sp. PA-H2]